MLTEVKPEHPIKTEAKPAAVNQEYPLHSLDHRDFEKLLYCLFENRILNGRLRGLYDNIWLMEGVREKGRDCSLYKDNVLRGIIQCKHSSTMSRTGKPEVVKEIIKFLLHIINEERTIEAPFEYYFAVSFGFDSHARELLEDFNTNIFSESALDKWAQAVIKENKALQGLVFPSIKHQLYTLLKSITIRHMELTDITKELNEPYNKGIIATFFTVTMVVRESVVMESLEKLRDTIREKGNAGKEELSLDYVLEKFDQSSIFLHNHRSEFFNVPVSHVQRKETKNLHDWITSPLPRKEKNENIILLTGNAGTGKSVILKDLRNILREENIPVLAIKADRFSAESIKELEEKLNLTEGITRMLEVISSQCEKIVLLIDQIDALSQALSSKREAINSYHLLIETAKDIPNVRIVISARTFDLNYDPDLQCFKSQKVIKVEKLTDSEIDVVLKKLDIEPAAISPSVRRILGTPSHLNVFCRIVHPGAVPASLETTQDLYNELWRQTLAGARPENNVSSASLKEYLQKLALSMNEKQQISLPIQQFSDSYGKEIDHLSSEGILVRDHNSIQFFHQTFYDFVFAKNFVESGQSVEDFITKSSNSLHIRSGLKMIMGFLREEKNDTFVKIMQRIISSNKYSFHIKLLLYNLLGFIEDPTEAELQMIQKAILPMKARKQLYLESVYSVKQLVFLIQGRSLQQLLVSRRSWTHHIVESRYGKKLKLYWLASRFLNYRPYADTADTNINLCFSLLSKHLPQGRNAVVKFLLDVPEFEEKPKFVFRILYFLKIWDTEDAFHLFERYREEALRDAFQIYHILMDIVPVNPGWAVAYYRDRILSKMNANGEVQHHSHDSYLEGKLLDKLAEANPTLTFELAWEILNRYIHNSGHSHQNKPEILVDAHLLFYTYDRSDRERGMIKQLYTHLIEILTVSLARNLEYFETLYKRVLTSNKLSFFRMLAYAFDNQNTNLDNISPYFFNFFKDAGEKLLLVLDDKLEFLLRKNLKKYYSLFTDKQKSDVIDILIAIKDPHELKKHSYSGKPDFFRNQGHTIYKYLTALPKEDVLQDHRTKKLFGELERKYGTVREREPYRVYTYGVGAPLDEKAYEKMNFDQWLNSFKRYDSDDRENQNNPAKGGLTENYRAFKEEVKNRPDHFFPFVERLFKEEVHPLYLIAGLDGLQEGKVAPADFLRLYKLAACMDLDRFETLQLIWMARYLIAARQIDDEVLNFLVDKALRHPDPLHDRGQAMQDALNTVRGAAAEKLGLLYYNAAWSKLIFEALERVAEDPCVSVRVSLILNIAYLMNLDQERAFSLFLTLTRNYQPEVYNASLHSAQYLINYSFERLFPYFSNAIGNSEGIEELASLIAIAYIKEKPGSENLLNRAFSANDELRRRIIHTGWSYIINDAGQIDQRAATLFLKGKDLTSEAVTQEYAHAFLSWKPEHFPLLYPLIYTYSRSKAGRRELHYYYEYLLKCVKTEPEKCLTLISNIHTHIEPAPGKQITQEEPIEIVIGIYNVLCKRRDKMKEAKKALKLFDYLLQNPTYRRNASKVTEEVEI